MNNFIRAQKDNFNLSGTSESYNLKSWANFWYRKKKENYLIKLFIKSNFGKFFFKILIKNFFIEFTCVYVCLSIRF